MSCDKKFHCNILCRNDGENYDSEGHPIGMVIEDLSTLPTKKLYEGKMPTCKQELIEILTDTRVLIK